MYFVAGTHEYEGGEQDVHNWVVRDEHQNSVGVRAQPDVILNKIDDILNVFLGAKLLFESLCPYICLSVRDSHFNIFFISKPLLFDVSSLKTTIIYLLKLLLF